MIDENPKPKSRIRCFNHCIRKIIVGLILLWLYTERPILSYMDKDRVFSNISIEDRLTNIMKIREKRLMKFLVKYNNLYRAKYHDSNDLIHDICKYLSRFHKINHKWYFDKKYTYIHSRDFLIWIKILKFEMRYES